MIASCDPRQTCVSLAGRSGADGKVAEVACVDGAPVAGDAEKLVPLSSRPDCQEVLDAGGVEYSTSPRESASMAGVLCRVLAGSLLLLSLSASDAAGALSDRLVPLYDASHGVRAVSPPTGGVVIRFGPKAAGVYRKLAGRRVGVTCADAPGGDLGASDGSGTSEMRAPRRRGALFFNQIGRQIDVCAVSTRGRRRGPGCLAPHDADERDCVRVIVALTEAGRAAVDETARAVDLAIAYYLVGAAADGSAFPPSDRVQGGVGGDEFVALDAPDAVPPSGRVGYWSSGTSMALVVVTQAGARRFLRFDGDVFSSNVPKLLSFDGVATLF